MLYRIIKDKKSKKHYIALYMYPFNIICCAVVLYHPQNGVYIGTLDNNQVWADPGKITTISQFTGYEIIRSLLDDEARELKDKLKSVFVNMLNGSESKYREPRICPSCGMEFTPTNDDHIYCSRTCQKREHVKKKQKKVPRHFTELTKIYVRDNGICWICGEKCDFDDFTGNRNDGSFRPGPKYPSLDHVIPVSLGGSNKLSNIRIAHLECNGKRDSHFDPLEIPGYEVQKKKEKESIYTREHAYTADILMEVLKDIGDEGIEEDENETESIKED